VLLAGRRDRDVPVGTGMPAGVGQVAARSVQCKPPGSRSPLRGSGLVCTGRHHAATGKLRGPGSPPAASASASATRRKVHRRLALPRPSPRGDTEPGLSGIAPFGAPGWACPAAKAAASGASAEWRARCRGSGLAESAPAYFGTGRSAACQCGTSPWSPAMLGLLCHFESSTSGAMPLPAIAGRQACAQKGALTSPRCCPPCGRVATLMACGTVGDAHASLIRGRGRGFEASYVPSLGETLASMFLKSQRLLVLSSPWGAKTGVSRVGRALSSSEGCDAANARTAL
jgi:hypothetical protein